MLFQAWLILRQAWELNLHLLSEAERQWGCVCVCLSMCVMYIQKNPLLRADRLSVAAAEREYSLMDILYNSMTWQVILDRINVHQLFENIFSGIYLVNVSEHYIGSRMYSNLHFTQLLQLYIPESCRGCVVASQIWRHSEVKKSRCLKPIVVAKGKWHYTSIISRPEHPEEVHLFKNLGRCDTAALFLLLLSTRS